MYLLAIESSCDDSSVAIIDDKAFVHICVSEAQDEVHKIFGGVVPEIASRNHSLHCLPLVDYAIQKSGIDWSQINAVAATSEPGLIGSLLVGLVTAKTLALAKNKSFIGVNHLEGHLMAAFLNDSQYTVPEDFSFPYIALTVSGGHTSLYWVEGVGQYQILGKTLDDAGGEAFDKFAKMLKLEYPGGVKVDRNAQNGDVNKYHFPRALMQSGDLNFSFSGLKANAQRLLQTLSPEQIEQDMSHLCAGFQESVVDSLLFKAQQAVLQNKKRFPAQPRLVITGGVSANSRLRAKALQWGQETGVQVLIPPIRYCTDNAAMIAFVAMEYYKQNKISGLDLAASAVSTRQGI